MMLLQCVVQTLYFIYELYVYKIYSITELVRPNVYE